MNMMQKQLTTEAFPVKARAVAKASTSNQVPKKAWMNKSKYVDAVQICIKNDRQVPSDKQLCHVAFSQKKKIFANT